jgi:histidinol-phosphate aminotransferase
VVGAIKLDANESPYPLSAEAQATLAAALAAPPLHRYPDAAATALRSVLASRLGVAPDELALANGSDEHLGLLCATFGEPRRAGRAAGAAYLVPGFSVFRTAALAHGLAPIEIPLGPGFVADEAALLEAVDAHEPNLIFLASPNNPTGTVWPRRTIERVLAHRDDVIVVVDEAYQAYSEQPSCLDLARTHPHCLVLGTLSKIGLAALRIGFLAGRAEVISEVEKVRPPYNLDELSQRAASALLARHADELDARFAEVKRERRRLAAALAASGLEVFPSEGNFLLVRTSAARALFEGLARRGVLIRWFDRPPPHPLAGCLRITVGTPQENETFLSALADCRSQGS